jgi:hypothetical protein
MNALAKVEPVTGWTQAEAVALCVQVEAICPEFGCHVALTGGCLYKDGERKDLDLLFYRIRQAPEIDKDGLFHALLSIGIEHQRGFGWCHKATHLGRNIDCFFPEEDGEYPVPEVYTNTGFDQEEVVF